MNKGVKINVLGMEYNVLIHKFDNENNFGSADFKTQTIKLLSGLAQEEMLSTLLHEIIEIVNYKLELKLEHNVISSLEIAFYNIIKENKWLIELLMSKEKQLDIINKK